MTSPGSESPDRAPRADRLDGETAWRLLRALAAAGTVATDGEEGLRVRSGGPSFGGPGLADPRSDGESGAESGQGTGTRSSAEPGTGPWLEVRESGGWKTSSPATRPARKLLDLYLPLLHPSGIVMAQLAQSLDGRIATESGHSHYVSGPEDIRRLHRLRALMDAVVVGAGTVASDDPRLTVREVPGENPVRVVLDPERRLNPDHRVFSDPDEPTLVVERAGGVRPWSRGGVEPLELPREAPHGFSPRAVVEALRERGMGRILVEGGGVTVSRFLEAGVLQRLHVTVAPMIIGSGRPSFTLPPVETLDEALRPPCRLFRLGPDVLFDLDLGRTPFAAG